MAVTYGAERDVDPENYLLDLVRISAGAVWWMREIIQEMDPDALVYGEKTTARQVGHGPEGPVDITTTVHGAGLNEWVKLYQDEREHGRKVSMDAIKAGVKQRQVELAEQAGERYGAWLRASLAGAPDMDEQMARRVVAASVRNLHLLQGGAA